MNELSTALAKIVIDFCLFFEFSDSSAVDPDAATKMMEKIAYELQGLSESQKGSVCEIFNEISSHYDERFSSFILSLPENLGLMD
ncbi:hypothetical protein SLW56_16370 [Xanthomonas sp. LF07-6]|uniref:hypothetical protein n=1 Tax=Xanthomonas sp. LF07-6 TaxID=3097550 RepID=UPI002A7EC179|nr:hypothetical protein [Xanthomonas sp. LF07-6]MDY4341362.1 hypothetical protein [Xanthomonas sp. LF07-6]